MSRKLVTLKSNVPIKEKLNDFILKEINKETLFNFLREMEFNRLLSQAISFYGENTRKTVKIKLINRIKYQKLILINIKIYFMKKI